MGEYKLRLFESLGFSPRMQIPDQIDLGERVSQGGFTIATGTLRGEKELTFLGNPLKVGANLTVSYEIYAPNQAISLYGVEVAALAGRSFTELRLGSEQFIGHSGEILSQGSFSLTNALQVTSGFNYRYLHSAKGNKTRLQALTNSLQTCGLPFLIDLSKLKSAEPQHCELAGTFGIDFKTDVSYGYGGELKATLFDGLNAQATAEYQAALKASLGYGLREEMLFSVGTLGVSIPGWVRVRVKKLHSSKLSFGGSFALAASYDLGSGLEQILNAALKLDRVAEVMSVLEKLDSLAGAIASGDWNQVLDKLGAELLDTLGRYLKLDNIADATVGLPAVQAVINQIQQLVAAYNSLDEIVKDLWLRFMDAANLAPDSPFMKALQLVANLDPEDPNILQLLLDKDFHWVLELFETLCGYDIEDLILASNEDLKKYIAEAQNRAQQLYDFLQSPEELLTMIHDYARRYGVQQVVDWLDENATSTDKLKTLLLDEANKWLRRTVEYLIGKSIDQLNPADLKKIQHWVKKIKPIINQAATIDQTIAERLKKLKGETGFSIGFELDRQIRREALLDVEFEPTVCGKAFEELRTLGIKRFLDQLPDADPDKPLPYLFHDCLFSSRRTRGVTLRSVFPWFGKTSTVRRITEESIRLTTKGDKVTRYGQYAAGFEGIFMRKHAQEQSEWQSSLWLQIKGQGPSKDLKQAYDKNNIELSLRATLHRSDAKTTNDELIATQALLAHLGFIQGNELLDLNLQKNAPTSLAVLIEFHEPCITNLFSGLKPQSAKNKTVNLDLLNSAYRWFNDQLHEAADNWGCILAEALRSDYYRSNWTQGNFSWDPIPVPYEGKTIMVNPSGHNEQRNQALFVQLPVYRGRLGGNLHDTSKNLTNFMTQYLPNHALQLVGSFAHAIRRGYPAAWNNPMLPLWFVIARLNRIDSSVLTPANVKGLALFRYIDQAGKRETAAWQNTHGLSHPIGMGIFPFSD